ncbi:RNA-directed DNA polymerase [Thiotrichales bacterium 19X7-9]|nr:RNA-directed DNA polymerase [Thiotrichales bacterium 19X7-9]
MSKKYYEFMQEISSDELLDGLLGHGMFAEKIPSFLTAEPFLEFCKNNAKNYGIPSNKEEGYQYISYESMRNINIPRILGIPTPMAYYHQCKVISKNWNDLIDYFNNKTKKHKYKISRKHIRKTLKTRGCEIIGLKDEYEKYLFSMTGGYDEKDYCLEAELLINKNYMVKADISNCFGSIYTHAIAWAIVGKNQAKTSKNKNNHWYNELDRATQQLNHNETHGILVGSHSSNIISEIILTAIDYEMYNKKYRYVRYIDDYSCYVKDRNQADEFLIDLSAELKKMGLNLNHKKTKIIELPRASCSWKRKLSSFMFLSNNSMLSLSEVKAYLDVALELISQNSDDIAILNYAIKKLSSKIMKENAKKYFIDTIHHLILIYPYLISILDENIFSLLDIERKKIKCIAQDIFKVAHKKQLFEAMSYALYFCIKYEFKLNSRKEIFDKVKDSDDCILLLLAYLYDRKFINHSKVTNKYKNKAKELKNDIDKYWLFVYEVLTVGFLDDYWKTMKQNKISFIKSNFKS